MDHSVAEQFVILALDPEKGRVTLSNIHFRYSLTGALLMDYLEQGEITTEKKRIVPFFRKNGELLHDLFADKIMRSSKNRKISFWISRMALKSRYIFREMIKSLTKEKIIRTEQRKLLNIFPYYRYWFIDISIRTNLIELLREILLYGKKPGKKEIMLLGLVEASRAYSVLTHERGESKLLRKKNSALLKGDVLSSEINQAIREIQTAIVASIVAATAAAHGSH